MERVHDLFKIKPLGVMPSKLFGRLGAPSNALNSPLILDRHKIIATLQKLGIPENIEDFQKDVLMKIITRQVENLSTDKDGKPVVIVFNSDRDNSTAYGHDVLSQALSENINLKNSKVKALDEFATLGDYLKVSGVMNQAQNNLLKRGVPIFVASGALKAEALNRINNGEAPPIAAAWSTATEHSLLAAYEGAGTNKGTMHYTKDTEYDRFLVGSVHYDKSFVVNRLKHLIENDQDCLGVNLRFQPSMDDVSRNPLITSLHLSTNLSNLDSYRERVQEFLGDKYSIKAGIDAEGNSLHASQGKETQMYINIEPTMDEKEFDGKETYFVYMDKVIRGIVGEQKIAKNQDVPEIVTFGVADSNNDIASITSLSTKGLAVIPSNAVDIRDPSSKLMRKLSDIPSELKTSLKQILMEQGATKAIAEKLSSNVKVVSQNPSRFIYFTETGNPDEKMSLSINNGYKLLHALIHLGKFTQVMSSY